MSSALNRGRVLYDQSRYEQAGAAFLEALSLEPDNSEAQAMLGLCYLQQKQYKEALKATASAIQMAPDESFNYYAHAVVQLNTNRVAEAERSIFKAIELLPYAAHYWAVAATCSLQGSKWQEALERAQQGLEANPSDEQCLNLRATALTHLGRLEDARAGLAESLADNPENPDTLANLGWAELHAGRYKPALEHFREALRIDAEHEYAREGLFHALRAHYPLYGLMLRFFLWMSKLTPRARMMVIVGLYLVGRFLSELARGNPELAPYLMPIRIAFVAFVLMTWLATPLVNLALRFNRYGRLALQEDEVKQSTLVAASLSLSLVALVGALITRLDLLFGVAGYCFLMTLPLSAIHGCAPGWPRQTMLGITAGLAALGALGLLLILAGLVKLGGAVLGLFAVLMLPAQFGANYLMQVQPEK